MILTNRWAVLALLCYVRVVMGLQLQAVSALAPLIQADLRIDYTDLGVLVGLFMLPGIPLAIPGGVLATRLGDKPVIVLALAMMTAGSAVFGLTDSYAAAFAGRLFAGTGSVLLMVLLPKVGADWFSRRELGFATGLLIACWPFGIAVALVLLPFLADWFAWRGAIFVTALASGLALVLILLCYRSPPNAVAPAARRLWVISRHEIGLVMGPSVLWLLTNMGFMILLAFTPLLLVERGMSVAMAGTQTSWATLLPILSYPFFGWLLGRVGHEKLFVVLGTVLSAVPFLLLPLGGPAWLWLALYGAIYPATTVTVITLVTFLMSPQSRATGLGIFYAFCYVGLAAGPVVAGYVVDMTGSIPIAIWVGGAVWLLMAPAVLLVRNPERARGLSA